MKKAPFVFIIFLILVISTAATKDKYHSKFVENFNKSTSKNFNLNIRRTGTDNRYSQGVESPSEKGTKIMLFKIDPEDPAGAGRGPEIVSKDFTHFGTYSARIKVPNVVNVQPNVGAVVGYFTYHMDSVAGLSEIDFEWLIADPTIIYVGTWTGERGNLQRIGRIINLAEGVIYSTSHRIGQGKNELFTDRLQNLPETIQPIENYDASSQFYTYGFDWYPDRLRWWMLHPTTGETIVLWDYSGSTLGIPQNQTHYRLNFWHTNNWPVETNRNSIEKPLHNYELEIDWISYSPYKKSKL